MCHREKWKWLILWSCEHHVILSGRCCTGTQTKERPLFLLLCSAIVYQNCVGRGNPWREENKTRCRLLRSLSFKGSASVWRNEDNCKSADQLLVDILNIFRRLQEQWLVQLLKSHLINQYLIFSLNSCLSGLDRTVFKHHHDFDTFPPSPCIMTVVPPVLASVHTYQSPEPQPPMALVQTK